MFAKNADPDNYFEERAARVYRHYEESLTRNNALDFDDLLMKSVQLLREFPEVKKKYQDPIQLTGPSWATVSLARTEPRSDGDAEKIEVEFDGAGSWNVVLEEISRTKPVCTGYSVSS